MSKIQPGWYRFWLVIAAAFLLIGIWQALAAPYTRPSVDGETCVPGTRMESTDYDKVREPTPAELLTARSQVVADMVAIGIKGGDNDLDFHAKNLAEMTIYRAARFDECVSLIVLTGRLFWALLAALAIAPLFLIARWVFRGFTTELK